MQQQDEQLEEPPAKRIKLDLARSSRPGRQGPHGLVENLMVGPKTKNFFERRIVPFLEIDLAAAPATDTKLAAAPVVAATTAATNVARRLQRLSSVSFLLRQRFLARYYSSLCTLFFRRRILEGSGQAALKHYQTSIDINPHWSLNVTSYIVDRDKSPKTRYCQIAVGFRNSKWFHSIIVPQLINPSACFHPEEAHRRYWNAVRETIQLPQRPSEFEEWTRAIEEQFEAVQMLSKTILDRCSPQLQLPQCFETLLVTLKYDHPSSCVGRVSVNDIYKIGRAHV